MKRILVIDDSVAIRKAIRRILEQMNYAVTEAEDGESTEDGGAAEQDRDGADG